MKFYLLLFSLLTIARCQDWTCDDCAEGGAALGEFLSSEENIFGEIFLLITEICPQHPDPDYCADNLPTYILGYFWTHCLENSFQLHLC